MAKAIFTEGPIIDVNWDDYDDENGPGSHERLQLELWEIGDTGDPWYMESKDTESQIDEIRTQEFVGTPEKAIKDLRPVIKFLNDNNIPWHSYPIAFVYKDYAGSIFITNDTALLVKVYESGDIEKEIFPLYKNRLH